MDQKGIKSKNSGSDKTDGQSADGVKPSLSWVELHGTQDAASSFGNRAWASTARAVAGNDLSGYRWWDSLPLSNQLLLGGCLLLTLGTGVRAAGPPLAYAAKSAVFPYTQEGKRVACADNLRAIYLAASQYAQDYDSRFPLLETSATVAKASPRRTWVSALQPYAHATDFQCPVDPVDRDLTQNPVSSYVINPVLAGHKADDVDDPTRALFMTEGGAKHDVSLLPPMPSWPQSQGSAAETNLVFRHGTVTNALYADGHVDTIEEGVGPHDGRFKGIDLWGGSAATRLALDRIAGRDAVSGVWVKQLLDGNTAGAAPFLRAHRAILGGTSKDLLALCLMNGVTSDDDSTGMGQSASDKVVRLGWNLAQAENALGDRSAITSLNKKMAAQSSNELQSAKAAGSKVFEIGSGLGIEAPSNWTMDEKQDGRYRRVYLKSHLKDITILCEIGTRNIYHIPSPVDWGGMEADLKRQPGSNYRRIRLQANGILAGMPAGVWEYEMDKPGSPRLRKLYVGQTDEWRSYVVACTAPAAAIPQWRAIFERAFATYGFGR